ncbi:Phytocyanin domain-containing protein [Citrus sinensis]|nr:Phytocyanin domain-containing protein [Citrus sinensis]
MVKALVMIMAVALSLGLGGQWAAAQVHHVVGGDRGWDSSSDVASWSAGRVFRAVLAYSPAQESIAELQSKEEYESCNVSNPIRMYTDGLDVIPLDGEGIHYFVSSKYDNCKNGLKLHVNVLPQPHQSSEVAKVTTAKRSAMPFAVPPTTPSDSTRFRSSFILFFVRLGLFYMDL